MQNDPGGHFKGTKLPSGQYSPAPPQAAEQPDVESAVTLPWVPAGQGNLFPATQ